MYGHLLSLLVIVSIFLITGCSKEDDIPPYSLLYPIDGPYVFSDARGYKLVSVDSNRNIINEDIPEDRFPVQSALDPDLTFQVTIRNNLNIDPHEYTTDKKVLAVSDIEGNLPLFLEFLVVNNVINDQLEWSYGENHLVIIGDLFYRGVDVTALLWYVYKLEGEAEKHGGKVHVLLGNHEALVLSGDDTFTRDKYKNLAIVLETSLKQLYGDHTVLGQWIRTKNTIEKINGVIYCHAGISYSFIQKGIEIEEANQKIRDYLGIPESQFCSHDTLACFLYGKNGPLWYNGYFYPRGITTINTAHILLKLHAERIVVGHSKVSKMKLLFNMNVIAIDTHTTSKNNEGEYSESYCEGLLIEDGVYYSVNNLGKKAALTP